MKETQPSPQPDDLDVRQLARAIRFAFVALVLGLSYFSLRGSFGIGAFEQIFADMLGGRPLPWVTTFLIKARAGFVVGSVLVPIVALATLRFRNLAVSFYVLGVLVLLSLGQFITIYHALLMPLQTIINGMTQG